jgi:exodeoxyribonuclease V gamma subunit
MSFKLYISNRLDELQSELSKDLRQQTTSVFHKDVLITQTEGMNRWLSIELAKSLNIFANAEFHKPNGFISKVFQLAKVVDSQDFSTEKLRWVLYKLLNEPEFIEKFDLVAQYYEGDEIKRLQLATRVSDLFDQYLIYRPDFIQAWNKGEVAVIKRDKYKYHEEWQSWLWKKLQEQVDFEDKVELRNRLVEQFDNPLFIDKLKDKFPKVSLVGLSVLTPFHLEIFSWLSRFIDVHFYQLNPSPEFYWYDQTGEKSIAKIEKFTKKSAEELLLQSGNTLLSNWGKIGKDAFTSLFEHDEVLNIIDSTKSIAPKADSLLGKLQSDVFNNEKEEVQTIDELMIEDGSLQISSCYTPVREVEVFYNYLLNLMENNSTIEPKDILILVNDIDLYAPFIKAIFDNSPIKIPYSIADRSFVGGDTISSVLEILLKLSVEEFTSENILQLVEFDIVKSKFGFTDIELIRRVMNDANIRYGISGDRSLDTDLVSWKHGLERIILGIAIKGGEEYFTGEKASTYPLDTIEGGVAGELLRFKAFADAVIQVVQQRREARTLADWRLYVDKYILQALIDVNDQVMEEYHIIMEHLALLDEVSPVLEEVSFEVFQKAFLDSLVNNVHAGNFITGRVTFCSMIPMRSIPFEVIALLGMNNDAFPRKDNKLGFNLLEDDKRRGDREVKESDKYLFLESFLSAKRYFYLSYIGKNTKDNALLSPSILIDELLDYIEQSYKGAKDSLIIHHPLHGFSSQYFEEKKGLFTYFGDKMLFQKEERKATQESLVIDFSEIHLNQLISFYKDPIKWYFNKALGIYFNDEQKLLPENELFELDNLEQYVVRKELFGVADEELESFKNEAIGQGILPLKNMALVQVSNLNEEIETLKINFAHFSEGHQKLNIELSELKINNSNIHATIDTIYDDNQVVVCYSKQKSFTKHCIEPFLKHLFLIASGKKLNTVFLIRERKESFLFKNDLVSQTEAKELLGQLVHFYKTGHDTPLPFLPKWSCKSFLDEKKYTKSLEAELKFNEYATLLDKEGYFDSGKFNKGLFDELGMLVFGKYAPQLTKQDLD